MTCIEENRILQNMDNLRVVINDLTPLAKIMKPKLNISDYINLKKLSQEGLSNSTMGQELAFYASSLGLINSAEVLLKLSWSNNSKGNLTNRTFPKEKLLLPPN